jgi:hypothetical protein
MPSAEARAATSAPTYPERLPQDFCPDEHAPFPFSGADALVRLRDVPREGEHHGDGVFGGRDGVASGGVHHDDAAAGGRVDVDIVDPRPGPPHDSEGLPRLEDVGPDARLAPDDQRVGAFNQLQDLGVRGPWMVVGMQPLGLEDRETLGIDGVRDQDLHERAG